MQVVITHTEGLYGNDEVGGVRCDFIGYRQPLKCQFFSGCTPKLIKMAFQFQRRPQAKSQSFFFRSSRARRRMTFTENIERKGTSTGWISYKFCYVYPPDSNDSFRKYIGHPFISFHGDLIKVQLQLHSVAHGYGMGG